MVCVLLGIESMALRVVGRHSSTELLTQPSVLVQLSPSCPRESAISCRGLVAKWVLTFISFKPNRQLEVFWKTEEQGPKG